MANPWPDNLITQDAIGQMFDNDAGDQTLILGRVLRPGTITSVEFIPNWNMTGAATNNRTFTLFNRRGNGQGTTTLAVMSMTSGASITKFSAVSLTLQTAANLALAVGDILEWESLHVGSGIPDPGGLVIVQQNFQP